MIKYPFFSVIIPTCNRNKLLAKCLDCLAPEIQTFPATQYEVIVTDDGSEITAKEMIRERYPWAKWVPGPRKGPAANRNHGVKYSQGDWLAFTDDDCLPDANWLKAYAEATAKQTDYLVLEGRTYVDRPRQRLDETSPINETGGYLWSCNFSIHRKLFDEISGFDERFPYAAMEDIDLRTRLKNNGYNLLFTKNASVCHPWQQMQGWEKLKQHQKSTLIYLSIHPEEVLNMSSMFYLKMALCGLTKKTIPELIKFNYYGIEKALLQHISALQMAYIVTKIRKS